MKLLKTTALLSVLAAGSAFAESSMEFTWTLAGTGDTGPGIDPVCDVLADGASEGTLTYDEGRKAYSAVEKLGAQVRVNQAVEIVLSLKDGAITSTDTTAAAENVGVTRVDPAPTVTANGDLNPFNAVIKAENFDNLAKLIAYDVSGFSADDVHEAAMDFQPMFYAVDADAGKHLTNGQGYEATLVLTCTQSAN